MFYVDFLCVFGESLYESVSNLRMCRLDFELVIKQNRAGNKCFYCKTKSQNLRANSVRMYQNTVSSS